MSESKKPRPKDSENTEPIAPVVKAGRYITDEEWKARHKDYIDDGDDSFADAVNRGLDKALAKHRKRKEQRRELTDEERQSADWLEGYFDRNGMRDALAMLTNPETKIIDLRVLIASHREIYEKREPR